MKLIYALTGAVLFVSGCAAAQSTPSHDEINQLGGVLTRVAEAADGYVRYGSGPLLNGRDLLREAVEPDELARFQALYIDARRQGNNVVVLVCDRPGGRALLEDSGCLPGLSRPRNMANEPCAFTIEEPVASCAAYPLRRQGEK